MHPSLSCEEVSFKQINALEIAMGLLADNSFLKAFSHYVFLVVRVVQKDPKDKGIRH